MKPDPRTATRPVLRWQGGRLEQVEVPLVREVAVTLRLNGADLITLLATDDALEFLAAGFLKAEGFLQRREQVTGVAVDREAGVVEVSATDVDPLAGRLLERRTVTSGCGKGTTFTHAMDALAAVAAPEGPRVSPGQVLRLMTRLSTGSELHRSAGGVHSAALGTPEGIELFRDDIGRHNAVDKIHGECFLLGIPVHDKLLLTTGRVSSEILVKAAKLGVPILASRSSATLLAVELAERTGTTVIGRVRGGGLTVYAGPGRVLAT